MSPKEQPSEWDAETKKNILWFKMGPKLPDAPFSVESGVTVLDKKKFLAAIEDDIAHGPGGPRALTGAIQSDLAKLRKLGS